jgi:hypothetical protein
MAYLLHHLNFLLDVCVYFVVSLLYKGLAVPWELGTHI